MTIFLRAVEVSAEDKGSFLSDLISAANHSDSLAGFYEVTLGDLKAIPGTPLAYWASNRMRDCFAKLPVVGQTEFPIRQGLATADDFRFARLWWEILPMSLASGRTTLTQGRSWVNFAKGGAFSRFYDDVHLVVNWEDEGEPIRQLVNQDTGRPYSNIWMLRDTATECFFRPGLTWPRRTQKGFSVRVMPAGCIFADKGPAVVLISDDTRNLTSLLGVMNSRAFQALLELQMCFGSYEVGAIQRTPIPILDQIPDSTPLHAVRSYELARSIDQWLEVSHAFKLPTVVQLHRRTLVEAAHEGDGLIDAFRHELLNLQTELDGNVADEYGLTIEDFTLTLVETTAISHEVNLGADDEADDSGQLSTVDSAQFHVQTFAQWALGCASGRWDVRFALDQSLLPTLQGPFDPLPRCSPGMLVGPEGLPATPGNIVSEAWLRARPNAITLPPGGAVSQPTIADAEYPLRVDWDGIIPDDDDHRDDIVRRVRDVLELLWGEQSEAIEREACQILGVASLRDYFRQPKHFYDFHIKRYSKSRRKAPIYWLLQSAKKNYGLWLYYHRLDPDTLFKALTLYTEPKLSLERIRLDDLRGQLLPDLPARDRRALEKRIAKQEALIAEITAFRNELERVARLQLPPDFNDGVIISIAPLHTLTPWKEAEKMWDELVAGKYGWSTMSQHMRARGLVKG